MNRTQIEQEVKDLEAQLEEKRKQLEETKGENYYYVDVLFGVVKEIDSCNNWDDILFNAFNYFQTKEEAEAMSEKTKLMFEMTARVKELNGDWVADWSNENQLKYGVKLNSKKCGIDAFSSYNPFSFNLSVQSKEHAEILLEEFKKRIEKWY